MFAMYDDDGLNFRDTIDRLYNLHQVRPTQAIKNDTKENKHFNDDLFKGKINKESREKYKQIANLDTKVEIFHVEQIMSHISIIIDDSKTIKECYELMEDKAIQQLLISSKDGSNLKGMVTKQDILRFLMNNNNESNILNYKVNEISTKNIITTDPISDIRRVSKVMIDFNLNAIPVVNSEHEIVGVVSRHDIVKAVSSIPHLQIWA
ncbi:MAG: CBS domain-containing protein [Campylobacterota bacterium]|nr:CBS domain-containing protein [Campylobacterota bacterium]